MTIAEKLAQIAERIPFVYEAGQRSMVDESKIIEKTVSGSVIALDDVSEVPHEFSVQLVSNTVTDFSGVNVRVSSRNLIKYPYINTTMTMNGITFTDNGDTSITISGKATADATFMLFTLDVGTSNMWNESVNNNGYFVSGCKHFFYNGSNKIHSIAVASGTDYSVKPITVKPQLYKGNSITDAVTIYKPNADGTLTIKSISPNMYIAAETDDIYIFATYHKSFGMQTEYDRFWDAYQNNGEPMLGDHIFAGKMWNDTCYNPKHSVVLTQCTNMYRNCLITDTKVDIDVSRCSNSTYCFNNAEKLVRIRKLIVSENTIYTGWFAYDRNIEEIRFEGVIGNSLDIHWSTKLSADSYLNILEHLSPDVTGMTVTLPTVAEATFESKYGEGTWELFVTTSYGAKNWTFAYA